MTGITHMLGGLTAGAGIVVLKNKIYPAGSVDMIENCAFMASSTVIALCPDIDEIRSTIGRRFLIIPLVMAAIKAVLYVIELFTFGRLKKKIRDARKALSHRGIFHWFITCIMFSIMVTAFGVILYLTLDSQITVNNRETSFLLAGIKILIIPLLAGFFPGYMSHILLDLVSGKIQFFAPFSKKWYGVHIIEVGSLAELFIVRPLLVFVIICILRYGMTG